MVVCKTTKCRVQTGINNDGYCVRCVRRQQELADDTVPYPCGTCSKNCDDENCGVLCELCLSWYHIVCVDMARAGYDWLKKMPGTRWFCNMCNSKVDKVMEKANSLEVETNILKTDMSDVKTRLEKVEKKLAGSVKQEIGSALSEQADIEKRKMNLVVFNLPEPKNTENTVWDNPRKIEEDTKALKAIIEDELHINLPETAMVSVRRLGKLDTESDSAKKGIPKPRPVKIVFADLQKKRNILSEAKMLRKCTSEVAQKLFINPDLTPEQRKIDQELRKEMWRRRSENNENVVIRRGKIVEADHEVLKTRTTNANKKPASQGTLPGSS